MPRNPLSQYEKELRKKIAINLKNLSGNLTQYEISSKTGIPTSTLSGYFAERSTIKPGNAEKLANLFNVSIDEIDPRFKEDLLNENKEKLNTIFENLAKERQQNVLSFANKQYNEQNKVASLDEYRKEKECGIIEFPKIGATGAGVGEELYADIIEDTIEVYEDEIPDNADFCILVNGDSMEPIFKKGSYAFIEKQEEAKNGQIVLVLLEGSALIKKFEIDGDFPKLVSLNPEYDDIYIEKHHQCNILGKVVM